MVVVCGIGGPRCGTRYGGDVVVVRGIGDPRCGTQYGGPRCCSGMWYKGSTMWYAV